MPWEHAKTVKENLRKSAPYTTSVGLTAFLGKYETPDRSNPDCRR